MRYNRQSTRYRILSTVTSLLASLLAGMPDGGAAQAGLPHGQHVQGEPGPGVVGSNGHVRQRTGPGEGLYAKGDRWDRGHGQSLALVHRNSASALGADQTAQTCTDRLGDSALCRSRGPGSGIPRFGAAGGAEAMARGVPDIAASRSARLRGTIEPVMTDTFRLEILRSINPVSLNAAQVSEIELCPPGKLTPIPGFRPPRRPPPTAEAMWSAERGPSKRVPQLVTAPSRGVALSERGLYHAAMDKHTAYLLADSNIDDMVFRFRKVAGIANPPGSARMGRNVPCACGPILDRRGQYPAMGRNSGTSQEDE